MRRSRIAALVALVLGVVLLAGGFLLLPATACPGCDDDVARGIAVMAVGLALVAGGAIGLALGHRRGEGS